MVRGRPAQRGETHRLSGCFSIPPDVGVSRHGPIAEGARHRGCDGGCGRPPGAQAEERLEAGQGGPPPIVPKDELIEVGLELPAAHSVVSAHEPGLEVAGHPVGKRNGTQRPATTGAGSAAIVRRGVAGRGEPLEALRPSV